MLKLKRILATILALSLVLSTLSLVTVFAEEQTDFTSPTVSTAELFEIVNKANQTIKQTNKYWRYGYMPVDGKTADFVEYNYLEKEVEGKTDDYWICAPTNDFLGGNKKSKVFWLPGNTANATAAVFTVPRDGKVSIGSDTALRAWKDANANPTDADMQFQIILNDKVIFPASGSLALPPEKAVKLTPVVADVKAGDKIVYKLFCAEGRTNVDLIPSVSYGGQSSGSTGTTTVTVKDGDKFVETILEPGKQFDIVNKSSGKLKQIDPLWRHGYAPIEGKVATDFVEFNCIDRMPPQEPAYWIMDVSGDVIGGNKKDGRTWTPSNRENAGTTIFTAPASGKITIGNENDGIYGINDKNANPQHEDSGIRILLNDKQIFPEKPGFLKLKEDEKYTFAPLEVEVKQGDIIAFQCVTFGSVGRTNVWWEPSITYGAASQTTEPKDDTTQTVEIKDMAGSEWAAEFINNLVSKKVMSAKDGKFEPNRAIRREEFAMALMLAFDLVDENATAKFVDVSASSEYYKAIASAKNIGVVNGISDTEFGTGATITREDLATMIYRAVEYKKSTLADVNASTVFADDAQISGYAKTAVYAMQKAGIVNGKGDNMFAPKDNATRAETAKILSMLIK